MLTIMAWVVFIPALIWNITLLFVAFGDIIGDSKISWVDTRNLRDLILSLAVLFIPGVYLFGWF